MDGRGLSVRNIELYRNDRREKVDPDHSISGRYYRREMIIAQGAYIQHVTVKIIQPTGTRTKHTS